MSKPETREDPMDPAAKPGSTPASAGEEENVSPRRAAQRLYDEMALAYHEQEELDREVSAKFLPVAVKSLRHEDE